MIFRMFDTMGLVKVVSGHISPVTKCVFLLPTHSCYVQKMGLQRLYRACVKAEKRSDTSNKVKDTVEMKIKFTVSIYGIKDEINLRT